MLPADVGYDRLEVHMKQPTSLNELQHRMFRDFAYQWRFFIDDRTIWGTSSSLLFRQLCIALLRLAAWDLEVSPKGNIAAARLPLGAETFPDWDAPLTNIYWFHGYLVVLCEGLKMPSTISAAVSTAEEFLNKSVGQRNTSCGVPCILISVAEIAFAHVSTGRTRCSTVFPLVSNSVATQCTSGFRILTQFLSSPDMKWGGRNLVARENSSITLPPEVFGMVLEKLDPFDVVSFAQASFAAESWYYSSLPQLSYMTIQQLEVSIPCCGRKDGDGGDGLWCSDCYAWQHSACVSSGENHACISDKRYICSHCRTSGANSGTQSLLPGAIGRANRRIDPRYGCRVVINNRDKILQLRVTSPAVMRPELRLRDRDLTSTPPNQIDYVVIFGGSWSGLAYGLDNLPVERRHDS
ncbi:hypothetical protein ONS95_007553 [Cadophora gregata]|uniref:uncharacterized protein n=1 Tax=Cadophora gregata TaxID=51156 RepID=UPI0026DD52CC|nr:uncharacterized protein ONS95_007553 [Cadophora gregata]KAK0125929.1 hypothetical protein ONS95_007553 [Cadophora gregata]